MDITAFNELTDDEKAAILNGIDSTNKELEDLQAERNSLREELTAKTASLEDIQKELMETKKVNYTLARQTAIKPEEDPETILHNIFGGNT